MTPIEESIARLRLWLASQDRKIGHGEEGPEIRFDDVRAVLDEILRLSAITADLVEIPQLDLRKATQDEADRFFSRGTDEPR